MVDCDIYSKKHNCNSIKTLSCTFVQPDWNTIRPFLRQRTGLVFWGWTSGECFHREPSWFRTVKVGSGLEPQIPCFCSEPWNWNGDNGSGSIWWKRKSVPGRFTETNQGYFFGKGPNVYCVYCRAYSLVKSPILQQQAGWGKSVNDTAIIGLITDNNENWQLRGSERLDMAVSG